MKPNLTEALKVFSEATQYIQRAGLEDELRCHREANFEAFTETDLLREAAWVILCSGFRESVVHRLFDHISLCFCDWESAREIVRVAPACRLAAAGAFRNTAKIDAIINVAIRVNEVGFEAIKESIIRNPICVLQQLPYIGPVTVWHLAKNLGLDVAKPDRHLARLSAHIGFDSAHELCRAVAHSIGETTRIVDLVLWRYLADTQWAAMKSGYRAT